MSCVKCEIASVKGSDLTVCGGVLLFFGPPFFHIQHSCLLYLHLLPIFRDKCPCWLLSIFLLFHIFEFACLSA